MDLGSSKKCQKMWKLFALLYILAVSCHAFQLRDYIEPDAIDEIISDGNDEFSKNAVKEAQKEAKKENDGEAKITGALHE